MRNHQTVLRFLWIAALVLATGCAHVSRRSGYHETGLASWYGEQFQGRKTANGEKFDRRALTAAHRTLPFGSQVRVRSLTTGKSALVRINDRGPQDPSRLIDLSYAAALAIGIVRIGTDKVALDTESVE